MNETLIGYARCSTDRQDLTAQRKELAGLGVAPERIYMDKGLTSTNRARSGVDQAMPALRKGGILMPMLTTRIVGEHNPHQIRHSRRRGLFAPKSTRSGENNHATRSKTSIGIELFWVSNVRPV